MVIGFWAFILIIVILLVFKKEVKSSKKAVGRTVEGVSSAVVGVTDLIADEIATANLEARAEKAEQLAEMKALYNRPDSKATTMAEFMQELNNLN